MILSPASWYVKIWFRGKSLESKDLDVLAERMGTIEHLSKNPKDRYYLSANITSAYTIFNRVVLGSRCWARLSPEQQLALVGHELAHIKERHSRYKAKHILAPAIISTPLVFGLSYLTILSPSLALIAAIIGFISVLAALSLLNRSWNREAETTCDIVASTYTQPEAVVAVLVTTDSILPSRFRNSRAGKRAATWYPSLRERIRAVRERSNDSNRSIPAGRLIIIRGVPGSGKTVVGQRVASRLGRDCFRIDLDMYAPEQETTLFERELNAARAHRYVVGELYSGLWHTSNPELWIGLFKETHLTYSFVLDMTMKMGFDNCKEPLHTTYVPRSLEEYKETYERFYDRLATGQFARSSKVIQEIRIDAEDKDWTRIADEILAVVES